LTSIFFHDIRILKEVGMKICRFFIPLCILLLIITFNSCSSSSGADTPTSKNIAVTIRNSDTKAVHVYFETEQPADGNLVNPGQEIVATILAHRIGHIFSVYVDDAADPGGTALLTTSVEVTSASYNSGTAELEWTEDEELLRFGW